jgi:formiminoglutamate deiminase
VYAEMATAGITTVGEFHYLHHDHGGRPYSDPNAMAEALREAANLAGIRLTLIDACYLHGGLTGDGYQPLAGVQQRFGDAGVDAWAARVELLRPSESMRVGVAAHSTRAVMPEELRTVAAAAVGRPLHVHLSEQPAENADVVAVHGCTPTELLSRSDFWGGDCTAVHATHLRDDDVTTLAGAQVTVCLCPTTERDLADGIGPARALHDAGVTLSLGSDQNAVIDLFEEARGMEMHERLTSNERGRFAIDEIMTALVQHDSLGWDDTGRIEPGARADLVAVRLDTARTAGSEPGQVVFAAGAADVDTVIVDGRVVVDGGHHTLGNIGGLLQIAIQDLSEDR